MTDYNKLRALHYATVVARWSFVVVTIFIATMSAGIYLTNHLLAKVYSATAAVEIQAPDATGETYSGWAFSSPQSRALEAELVSIESPEILRGVISDLALDKIWAGRIFNRTDPLTEEEALDYLGSHLRLNFKHTSNVVEVTALSDDPKEAAQIANEVVDLYKIEHEPRTTAAATQFMQETSSKGHAGGVKIACQAQVPFEPSFPNKHICYGVAAGLGGLLSVMVASTIEVCLLIARAEALAAEQQKVR